MNQAAVDRTSSDFSSAFLTRRIIKKERVFVFRIDERCDQAIRHPPPLLVPAPTTREEKLDWARARAIRGLSLCSEGSVLRG